MAKGKRKVKSSVMATPFPFPDGRRTPSIKGSGPREVVMGLV